MPMARRLPKVGFKNPFDRAVVTVNVGELEAFAAGATVTADALRGVRLVRGKFDELKILGDGNLAKKLIVQAHAFSATAKAKIEKAGGTAELLAQAAPSAS